MVEESEQRATSREELDPEEIAASLSSADPTTRREAVDAFGALVRTDPDAATEYVDTVAARLMDESLVVARGTAEALVPIARERPDALVGQLDAIVEVLAADTIDLSVVGAQLLSPLAVEYPDDVAETVDRLLEILVEGEVPIPETAVPENVDRNEARQIIQNVQRESREKRQYIRQTAANVVVAVVESDPSHVKDIESLEMLLDDSDPGVVGPVLDTLGVVAESEPATVRPALDSILECLDHDVATVRARAVRTLGYLGDESAIPALRDIAAEDDDQDVSELAAETAAFLSEE